MTPSNTDLQKITQGEQKELMGADLTGLDLSGAKLAQTNMAVQLWSWTLTPR